MLQPLLELSARLPDKSKDERKVWARRKRRRLKRRPRAASPHARAV
jgi:hypothetical protein